MELDPQAIQTVVAFGLPVKARWLIQGTTLDFDFSAAGHGLRPVPDEARQEGNTTASDLLAFDVQDFAQGGRAADPYQPPKAESEQSFLGKGNPGLESRLD